MEFTFKQLEKMNSLIIAEAKELKISVSTIKFVVGERKFISIDFNVKPGYNADKLYNKFVKTFPKFDIDMSCWEESIIITFYQKGSNPFSDRKNSDM